MSTRTASSSTSRTASTRSCRATTSRSWHTGSLAQESHILWVQQAQPNKATQMLWVSLHLDDQQSRPSCVLTIGIGIIPRAAALLFDKLDGPTNRQSTSGLRAPNRHSALPNLSATKSVASKNWQLKATYVEVRTVLSRCCAGYANFCRSTMSSYATCWSPSTSPWLSGPK